MRTGPDLNVWQRFKKACRTVSRENEIRSNAQRDGEPVLGAAWPHVGLAASCARRVLLQTVAAAAIGVVAITVVLLTKVEVLRADIVATIVIAAVVILQLAMLVRGRVPLLELLKRKLAAITVIIVTLVLHVYISREVHAVRAVLRGALLPVLHHEPEVVLNLDHLLAVVLLEAVAADPVDLVLQPPTLLLLR